jgi:peptide/nickel transport system substrate-binding protein
MMIQKRKVLSLITCFMVIGLIASLISGCAPSGNGGDGGDGDGTGDDTPQYGGELTVMVGEEPAGWDDAIVAHYSVTGPYECLWSGDWAKGIAGGYGTGECGWLLPGEFNRLEFDKGYLAESYEIGDDYIIFNLRDGVKWHDKPPCNGRELTADDVVFSLERQMTLDTAYLKSSYPYIAAAMDVYKVDEDTVRIDCDSEQMPELLTMIDFMYIYPQDVIELYGDMNDWERAIGTGAFTLEEYVAGSHLYWARNPDYWETNPVGPGEGDQLPYLDSYRVLIQPDFSTQDSLFTTGQIDIITCDTDRAQALMELPGVEYTKYFYAPSYGRVLFMRLDKEDKPWADVRVRQAMQLAIDNQKLVDELYGGDGEILYWPVHYCPEYAGAYLPLEDLDEDMIENIVEGTSKSVADLFGRNLELAQQLMADAGYPDGFKAEICVYNYQFDLDSIQAVASMLADIGVKLTLDAVDYATWTSRWALGTYNEMLYCSYAGVATYFKGTNWSGTSMWNASRIDDPVLNDYRNQMLAAYPDEDAIDQIHAEMIPYLLEQCYAIQTAGANAYRFWWPWVKNYSGEGSVGYYKALNPSNNYACVWIDQELKEEMGHGD